MSCNSAFRASRSLSDANGVMWWSISYTESSKVTRNGPGPSRRRLRHGVLLHTTLPFTSTGPPEGTDEIWTTTDVGGAGGGGGADGVAGSAGCASVLPLPNFRVRPWLRDSGLRT